MAEDGQNQTTDEETFDTPETGDAPRAFTPKKPSFVVPDADLPRFDQQDKQRVVGDHVAMDVPEDAARFENLTPPVPEDELPPSQRRELPQEPFLEHATAMRPTALFGLYLGIGGILGILSFVFAFYNFAAWTYYVSAIVAAVILLYLGISLMAAKSAAEQVRIQAERTVESEKLERGRLMHVTMNNEGSFVPSGLRAIISDQKAPGLRPVEPPTIEGVGEVRYKVRPQARGDLSFTGVDVRLRSRNGLWVQDQSWRIRTPVEVGPSTAAISWNAILSGYVPFDKDAPKDLVKLYREVEQEEQRDYLPGDRMKDVDWRRYAISGKMTIRRRWVDPETTIMFMLDMGQSMLMDQAGFRNLDLAVEVMEELMTWGLSRNHEVGFVAFNEERIIDHVRPTRAKVQQKILKDHLQLVCDYKHEDEWGEDGPPEITLIGDPENLRLGLGNAIKKRNTAGCTLILFSDMQTIHEDIVHAISKSAESGLPTIGMFMPPPSLRPYRLDDKAAAEEFELRGEEQAHGMRDLLLARGAEFLEVNPFPEETALFTEEELEQYRDEMMGKTEAAPAA